MTVKFSRDEFLGGALSIEQPHVGYRAGVDPVFLAAACPARPGDRVLELGCGVGTAILCLATRVADLRLTAVERQPDMAACARKNAAGAGIDLEVIAADIAELPASLRQRNFDHVIVNPPYFSRATGSRSPDQSREAAMGEQTPLATWVSVAARRLAPKGWLTLVHRAERLPDVLQALAPLGSVQVQPLVPRAGRDSNLVLVRARKSGRAEFRLHSPVILHDGERHVSDGEDYTSGIRAVLRQGAAFPGF